MGIILFPVYLIWKSELVILSCFEFTPVGKLSQVMMNSMNVPSKRSTLEKKLDKLILALFATLFSMCVIGAIGSGVFINEKYFYLGLRGKVEDQFNPKNRFVVTILTMFTLITLYSTIIPISLYVSIEVFCSTCY